VVLNFDNVGSMYYGDSESKMRKILGHVRELGDAVLFIDEADTFFPARGMHSGSSHNTDNKVACGVIVIVLETRC
jgi:SpoVK/Ycf46/Vps4 family AAA+-type ATPase